MMPDSVFGLRVLGNNCNRETYFFLEADRATMPVKRTNFYRSSFYKKMVGYISSNKKRLFSEYFGFKKIRGMTVTKTYERIQNMIAANKGVHELGDGYNLFLFAKNEFIHPDKPETVFKQIWINGQGKKCMILY